MEEQLPVELCVWQVGIESEEAGPPEQKGGEFPCDRQL